MTPSSSVVGGTKAFQPPGTIGKVVRAALALEIAIGVVSAVLVIVRAAGEEPFRFPGIVPGRVQPVSPFAFYPRPIGPVIWIASGWSLLTAISWLIWQHRVQSNVWAIPSMHRPPYSPGWAVGWWLIPFANFVVPYLTVRETSGRSAEAAGSQAPRRLLAAWWASWIAASVGAAAGGFVVLGIMASRFGSLFDTSTGGIPAFEVPMSDLRVGLLLMGDAYLVRATAAVLAIKVVASIDKDQATISAAGPPIPARPDLEPAGWIG
jgi:hypothetical protein